MEAVWLHFEERELVVAALALICLIFVFSYRKSLAPVPGISLLLSAFLVRVVGYQITVAEDFAPVAWRDAINVVEHGSYLLHSALLFLWVLRFWRERSRA